MKNNKKMSGGITLIALVVTIIVLLLLAGISIAMLSGNNGILQRATEAKTYSNEVQIKERIRLAELSARANGEGLLTYSALNTELTKEFGAKGTGYNISDETENPWVITVEDVTYEISNEENLPEITADTPAGTVVKTPSSWTSLLGKAISDGNGTAIPLPADFYYVGGDYNSGLVISDKENDNMNASNISMGNQFVWIPVSNEEDIERTDFNINTGEPTNELISFGEPDGSEEMEDEFNTMKSKVLKYGGFYIGRYEAGVNNTELRSKCTTDQIVVCKKGVSPYNFIPWGFSMSDINSLVTCDIVEYNESTEKWEKTGTVQTHGAAYLAKEMYSRLDSVTSTLCYGCQWDAMCRYIGPVEAKRTTPAKSTTELTGSVETDVSKNIYDLAGNCSEWTMEAYYTMIPLRVLRGGDSANSDAIYYRCGTNNDATSPYMTFRPTLYVN